MAHYSDKKFLRYAITLAKRHVGQTGSNPSVGCVIVKNNTIIAQGITAPGGTPHAETIALEKAGNDAKNATLYVSLEPCCHYGKTKPCTKGIIKAGISRVVIGTKDPFKKVSGRGIKTLKDSGIQVEVGLLENEAQKVDLGFFTVQNKGRPHITVKLAVTLDGKIATASGDSKWISNPQSRQFVHVLRSKHNAIMVGENTFKQDNPELTCRIKGCEHQSPIRIILDSKMQLIHKNTLQKTINKAPIWVVTDKNNMVTRKEKSRENKNIKIIPCDFNKSKVNLKVLFRQIASMGVNSVLIEGGSGLATECIKGNFIDELILVHAPKIIGKSGIDVFGDLGILSVRQAIKATKTKRYEIKDNLVEHYLFS